MLQKHPLPLTVLCMLSILDFLSKKSSTQEWESKVFWFLQSARPVPNKEQVEQVVPDLENVSGFTQRPATKLNSSKTLTHKFWEAILHPLSWLLKNWELMIWFTLTLWTLPLPRLWWEPWNCWTILERLTIKVNWLRRAKRWLNFHSTLSFLKSCFLQSNSTASAKSWP